jgi:hypothetical protein
MDSISNAQERSSEYAHADTAKNTSADISSILMNPSPVKTTSEADALRTTTPKQQGRPVFAIENDVVPYSSEDKEDSLLNDNEAQDERPVGQYDNQDTRENEVMREEQPAATEVEDIFDTLLKDMGLKVSRVGSKYDRDEKKWSDPFRHSKIYSKRGKRLDRRLKGLKNSYKGMKDAKASTDNDALENAQSEIRIWINELKVETENTLTSRLGDPQRGLEYFEEEPTRTILTDLYFNIIPKFVEVIKFGVDAHDAQGSIKTPALEEISDLLKFLYQLASGAVRQPSKAQPKPGKGQKYQVSQPTRELIPMVRQLRKKVFEELEVRHRTLASAEYERKQPERDRKRREEEEEEEAENLQRRKEIHGLQREALQRKLSEPNFGRILAADIEKEAAKAAVRSQRSMPFRYRTSSRQTPELHATANQEVEDDPFEDDDDEGYQRVHVFETNKNKRTIDGRNDEDRLKKWSKDERTYFIEGLRLHQGNMKPLPN